MFVARGDRIFLPSPVMSRILKLVAEVVGKLEICRVPAIFSFNYSVIVVLIFPNPLYKMFSCSHRLSYSFDWYTSSLLVLVHFL